MARKPWRLHHLSARSLMTTDGLFQRPHHQRPLEHLPLGSLTACTELFGFVQQNSLHLKLQQQCAKIHWPQWIYSGMSPSSSSSRQQLSWLQIKNVGAGSSAATVADAPARGRSGHTFTATGPNAYVFGGLLDGEEPPGPTADMWLVKMGAQQFEWHRITRKEPWPAPRWRHSATDIGLNRVLFFGGFRSAALRLNDCWIYNTVARCWEQLQEGSRSIDDYYDADEQQLPSPRGGHSA
eukprot:7848-Heterococcus_DN1.PRE.1